MFNKLKNSINKINFNQIRYYEGYYVQKNIYNPNINLKKSYFIGDRWRDVDAGNKSGCKTIFINRNYNEYLKSKPNYTAKKISEIYKFIN